jgi:hypothetical protein
MTASVPYPADTRAKGWRFELDHERIRQSDTWALATPDLRPWLLMLWMVAWEQTPCASLPADTALIAARIGMKPKVFAQHKEVLLRGWFEAADGRLYHATMTERVLHMLAAREKDAKRAAEYRKRASESNVSHGPITPESRVTRMDSHASSTPEPEPEPEPSTGTRQHQTTPPAGAPSGRATRKPPGNFALTPERIQWAREHAPTIDARAETETFRDHTFKTAISDWDGAWRNWMRRAAQFAPKGRQQQSTEQRDAEAMRLLGFKGAINA